MILIVDDHKQITGYLTLTLKSLGKNSLAFNDPLHALDVVDDKPEIFTHAILDLFLPKMNGLELCERLRMDNPNLKVLFFTGVNDHYNIELIKKHGSYLKKESFDDVITLEILSFLRT